jgi:hypothetical protein
MDINHRNFLCSSPLFGEQRTKYLLRKGVIRPEAGHLFYTDGTTPQQLMMNLVLVRNHIRIPTMNTDDIQTMWFGVQFDWTPDWV